MIIHDSLPSTADALREAALAGAPDGHAILARRQTAGRGTHGRSWNSPPGNLHLSVLLRPDAPLRDVPRHALLAAVALHDTAGPHTQLKWPNDLMLDGAKVAGILLEAGADGPRIAWLSVGFGVNLAFAPHVTGRATAALGAEPPEDFAARLLAALTTRRAQLAREGFAAIRTAWQAAGPAPGTPLSVTRGATTTAGRYEGLADDGGLRLLTDAGSVVLHAGEIA
ncbi:MAG: biotin--[acetyl-CoA-carboxylase] ligase [Alphaproteobacteria bacterium]|nr:biotin--[acetyl-CoA-carboxylase] ligase [Alphaproteobacteria bacterium]